MLNEKVIKCYSGKKIPCDIHTICIHSDGPTAVAIAKQLKQGLVQAGVKLKPLDLFEPYRLEMGTKLKIGTKTNLYQFWDKKITNQLNEELVSNEVFINLASNEYFKVIKPLLLKVKIITPVFKDYKNGQLKTISFFAKKARGLMVRYIIDNGIENMEELKGFNSEGYAFDSNLSSETELVFTR